MFVAKPYAACNVEHACEEYERYEKHRQFQCHDFTPLSAFSLSFIGYKNVTVLLQDYLVLLLHFLDM